VCGFVLQTGYGTATTAVDAYSLMSSYYPYYTMTDDMTAAGNVWSTGDATLAYGYGSDYGTMMADYGYGYGWFPGVDGSAWGTPSTIQPTVKDELGNTYAAPGGYYTVEAVQMYGGSENVGTDGTVAALEQGMQGMTMGDGNHVGEVVDNGTGASNGPLGGPKSWAAIAGQPATYRSRNAAFSRMPLHSGKSFGSDTGVWDGREFGRQAAHDGWSASRHRPAARPSAVGYSGTGNVPSSCDSNGTASVPAMSHQGQYNPKEFDLNPKGARFFIIKSYAEDDIHRSIKYGIWCSTEYGNKRLDAAYREREGKGPIYLFFSVNGSGHFCGIAQMTSAVDHQSSANVWAQDKWKGQFTVNWIYVKDVPNSQLRHIRLENNEGKPVTNSRDTQEVPPEKGCQVLRVIHQYRNTTSIFDDFSHYEKLQNEHNTQNVG